MKVYVMTEAEPFMPEKYLGVKATRKAAEKELRKKYPYMKPDGKDSYTTNIAGIKLLFIHEEEI